MISVFQPRIKAKNAEKIAKIAKNNGDLLLRENSIISRLFKIFAKIYTKEYTNNASTKIDEIAEIKPKKLST